VSARTPFAAGYSYRCNRPNNNRSSNYKRGPSGLRNAENAAIEEQKGQLDKSYREEIEDLKGVEQLEESRNHEGVNVFDMFAVGANMHTLTGC
jgi:hypothetical protein